MFRRFYLRSIVSGVRSQKFSSLVEPSLSELESMLTSSTTPLRITDIVSDQVIKISSVDGISIGSRVFISESAGGTAEGVVIQFNSNRATVGLSEPRSSITKTSQISLSTSNPVSFNVSRVPFSLNASPPMHAPKLQTGIPLVDMLFGQFVSHGQTVAIYSPTFKYISAETNQVLKFPSKPHAGAMDMYLDLIGVVNEAVRRSEQERVVLVADFRLFENACKSLEFQAECFLPVSPQSLVAAALQLSHEKPQGSGISVIAQFNSRTDFDSEASRSVDLEVDNGDMVSNLPQLLTRFNVRSSSASPVEQALMSRLSNGVATVSELKQRQEMGVFVDFWELDESESFSSLIKLLPFAARTVARAPAEEQIVLMRALTVLFFNKTGKRHVASIERFNTDLINVFFLEESHLMQQLRDHPTPSPELLETLDAALFRHRYRFELTNPLASL